MHKPHYSFAPTKLSELYVVKDTGSTKENIKYTFLNIYKNKMLLSLVMQFSKKYILIILTTLTALTTYPAHSLNTQNGFEPYILRNYKNYNSEQLTAYRTLLPHFQEKITEKCGWQPTVYPATRWQLLVLEADSNNYPDFNHQLYDQVRKHYQKQGQQLIAEIPCDAPPLKAWLKAITEDLTGYAAALLALKEISNLREQQTQDFMRSRQPR
ncbi:hypothetical protein [Kordiimonas laminariae]|uniref:hypothetical protein n=1 Tax=Kordiimonas laminariae TaxID=2917717 RepID=UPI001FF6774E|nr:hypothetical protein [Kordiimonas laminariae]MCK0068068.1 hypothetical protein [Kordiimonas laminariae]